MKTKSHPSEYQGVGPLFDPPRNSITYETCVVCGGPTGRSDRICSSQCANQSEFDGQTYEPKFDATRLRGEMARVYKAMNHMREQANWANSWYTLREISDITGDPEASISARLRDLRKAKFGGHTVNRRRREDPSKGIWEYQLL